MGIPAYVHLRRAKDLADRSYAEPLDVDALARTALCSRAHFIRSFKAAYGETPHQYLQRRRIERATELLRGTDRSVSDICLSVGFRSLGSFSAVFRRIVGEAPIAYRERARAAPPPHVPACFTLMWTRPAGGALSEKPRASAAGSVASDDHEEVPGP